MTPQRAHAYRRVMLTLDDMGPAKLHDAEQAEIRHAADTLIFTRDIGTDLGAHRAIEQVEQLCRALADSGRWDAARAMRLADDVARCGPSLLDARNAA